MTTGRAGATSPTTTTDSCAGEIGDREEQDMPDTGDVRAVVVGELERYLAEEGTSPTGLSDATDLVAVGLDSLGFAVLIARLEEALGFDPFVAIETAEPPRTLGHLVTLYTPAPSRQ